MSPGAHGVPSFTSPLVTPRIITATLPPFVAELPTLISFVPQGLCALFNEMAARCDGDAHRERQQLHFADTPHARPALSPRTLSISSPAADQSALMNFDISVPMTSFSPTHSRALTASPPRHQLPSQVFRRVAHLTSWHTAAVVAVCSDVTLEEFSVPVLPWEQVDVEPLRRAVTDGWPGLTAFTMSAVEATATVSVTHHGTWRVLLQGFRSRFASAGTTAALRQLCLHGLRLTDADVVPTLFADDAIVAVRRLALLDLSNNLLTDAFCQRLVDVLGGGEEDRGGANLPQCNIAEIHLASNCIGDAGMWMLTCALQTLTGAGDLNPCRELRLLDVRNNRASAESIASLLTCRVPLCSPHWQPKFHRRCHSLVRARVFALLGSLRRRRGTATARVVVASACQWLSVFPTDQPLRIAA
jgi:hypothetical protein